MNVESPPIKMVLGIYCLVCFINIMLTCTRALDFQAYIYQGDGCYCAANFRIRIVEFTYTVLHLQMEQHLPFELMLLHMGNACAELTFCITSTSG